MLGPADHLRSFSREQILAFRARRWVPERGGAFLVGNTDHLPGDDELAALFDRFPSAQQSSPSEPAPAFAPAQLVEQRDSNQSHLRMIYQPSVDVRDRRQRTALGIYSILLGGSMGSRLFDEIREQRGLCYSVWAQGHNHSDAPTLQLGAGLDSGKCVEAYTRMREIVDELRRDGPREEEVDPRPRLRRRAQRARFRGLGRRRAPRRQHADRRTAATSTPTPRSPPSTTSPSTRSPRSRAASARSSPSPSSVPTTPASSERPRQAAQRTQRRRTSA